MCVGGASRGIGGLEGPGIGPSPFGSLCSLSVAFLSRPQPLHASSLFFLLPLLPLLNFVFLAGLCRQAGFLSAVDEQLEARSLCVRVCARGRVECTGLPLFSPSLSTLPGPIAENTKNKARLILLAAKFCLEQLHSLVGSAGKGVSCEWRRLWTGWPPVRILPLLCGHWNRGASPLLCGQSGWKEGVSVVRAKHFGCSKSRT